MKKVVRYQCELCKKEFRTPNRHKCKFRPELKNCFTCKNFNGWNNDSGFDVGIEPPYPDCEHCEDWNIETIKQAEYNMQCEHWEQRESEVDS